MRKFTHGLLTLIALLVFSAPNAWAQFEYIWPRNGSINNFPTPNLILRNGALMDASSVTADKVILTGSVSGIVDANVILSTDGKTVCITPITPFEYGETVTAEVKEGLKTLSGITLSGTTYNFSIRKEMTAEQKQALEEYLLKYDPAGFLLNDPDQQTISVPHENSNTRGNALNFIDIYINNNPTPGEIFFHRNQGNAPTTSSGIGYGIMTSAGDSVFYRTEDIDGENFHINLNGDLTALRLDPGVDTGIIVMDSSYNIKEVVHCQNGLAPSQHEQLFFPDGTKWFTIHDAQGGWDLSQYGGSESATVIVSWIQKLGANNEVVFEWRADQNFEITDAAPDIFLTLAVVSPWHVNALHVETDGSLIASFRNMDRIVKINTNNGDIVWHWGGINSTYTDITTTGEKFSHQHNVHRIANGHILMFDNGNSLPAPKTSKAKEFVLDETNLTASLVWFYTHPQVQGQNIYTKNQGSVHRFSNGNTLIGYGLPDLQGIPNGTEIDASGNIVWEFRFTDETEYSYRIYKAEWDPNVGIGDIDESNNNLQIFPNPGNGLITINVDLPIAEKATISVVNLLGQKVFTTTKKFHSGINTLSLDLTALHKGMYVLDIAAGKTKMEKRLVIQ